MIVEHQQSGLSIKAWCKEKGISEGQFYYWLKIIREESLVQAGTRAIANTNQFVELKTEAQSLPNTQNSLCATVTLESGFELDVYNGADEQTLKSLIRLVGSRC